MSRNDPRPWSVLSSSYLSRKPWLTLRQDRVRLPNGTIIEDYNVLEDAIDRYFSREADRDLAEDPDARTYSMSEVVAALFEEDTGQGAA